MTQHALITGGSSGIGLAYAHHLSLQGWRVSLAAQSTEKLEVARKWLGPNTATYAVNLASSSGVARLMESVPVPDVLIANAGITRAGSVGTLSQGESADLQYLLCGGVIDLVQWAGPVMKARG